MLRENSMGKESQSEIGRLCYTKYEDRFRDIDSRIEKINDAIQEKVHPCASSYLQLSPTTFINFTASGEHAFNSGRLISVSAA